MAKTPKAPGALNVLGFRRRGFEVSRSPAPASAVLAGLFQTVVGSSPAQTGFDYYIASNGSDSNDGLTPATPWAVTAINTKRATYAGKVVGIMGGTYQLYTLIQAGINDGYTPVLDIAPGTSSNPTIIRAVNAQQAIFKCSNASGTPPSINNPVIGNHAVGTFGNVVIDGIKFQDPGAKCVYLGNYTGNNENYPGYVVQNCWFDGWNPSLDPTSGNNYSCVETAGALGFQCINNKFTNATGHFGAKDGNHMSATIQWFGVDCIYEYNTASDCPGFYGKENGNRGTILRYNYVDMTGWTTSTGVGAITDFSNRIGDPLGNPTIAHHNVLISANCIDLRHVLSFGDNRPSLQLYNNTLRVKSGGQPNAIIAPVTAGGAFIYNNIIYSEATGDLDLLCIPVGSVGTVDYNLYYSTTGTYQWGNVSSDLSSRINNTSNFSTWKSTTGGSPETHAIQGSNPLFQGSGANADFYQLQSGSPAKNAGRSNGTTGGSVVDMGAWGNSPPARIGCNF